jgi:hypothetical protein
MIFIVRLDFAGVKNESLLASVVRIERPWTVVWVAPFLKIGLWSLNGFFVIVRREAPSIGRTFSPGGLNCEHRGTGYRE